MSGLSGKKGFFFKNKNKKKLNPENMKQNLTMRVALGQTWKRWTFTGKTIRERNFQTPLIPKTTCWRKHCAKVGIKTFPADVSRLWKVSEFELAQKIWVLLLFSQFSSFSNAHQQNLRSDRVTDLGWIYRGLTDSGNVKREGQERANHSETKIHLFRIKFRSWRESKPRNSPYKASLDFREIVLTRQV